MPERMFGLSTEQVANQPLGLLPPTELSAEAELFFPSRNRPGRREFEVI